MDSDSDLPTKSRLLHASRTAGRLEGLSAIEGAQKLPLRFSNSSVAGDEVLPKLKLHAIPAIHHYNGLGNNHCEDFSMFRRVSKDDGASWSRPKIVHRFSIDSASLENPFGKPRLWPYMDIKSRSADGQKYLVMSTDAGHGNDLGSALFASTDDGKSWREITRTSWNLESFARKGASASWIAGIHAPVEWLRNGDLMAIGRSNDIDGFSPLSVFSDGGDTWRYSASPFPPILSGQRSVLTRLSQGPLLYCT